MKKILLIEDDEIIRESTAELLSFVDDYAVFTAANGKSGIDKALKEIPDIIICMDLEKYVLLFFLFLINSLLFLDFFFHHC